MSVRGGVALTGGSHHRHHDDEMLSDLLRKAVSVVEGLFDCVTLAESVSEDEELSEQDCCCVEEAVTTRVREDVMYLVGEGSQVFVTRSEAESEDDGVALHVLESDKPTPVSEDDTVRDTVVSCVPELVNDSVSDTTSDTEFDFDLPCCEGEVELDSETLHVALSIGDTETVSDLDSVCE